MKYLLINKTTGQQTLCEKVSIDGFDYYVSDAVCYPNDLVYSSVTNTIVRFTDPRHFSEGTYKKVIATTNPNIDIPKLVDEVQMLAFDYYNSNEYYKVIDSVHFINGYNKSQETHFFSEEDMIEFAEWIVRTDWKEISVVYEKSTKELLQLWKEQKPKTLMYE